MNTIHNQMVSSLHKAELALGSEVNRLLREIHGVSLDNLAINDTSNVVAFQKGQPVNVNIVKVCDYGHLLAFDLHSPYVVGLETSVRINANDEMVRLHDEVLVAQHMVELSAKSIHDLRSPFNKDNNQPW